MKPNTYSRTEEAFQADGSSFQNTHRYHIKKCYRLHRPFADLPQHEDNVQPTQQIVIYHAWPLAVYEARYKSELPNTRISEHKGSCRLDEAEKSAVAEHSFSYYQI